MTLLWFAMAALAAAACLPLLLALRRAPAAGAERAAVDIYRDQLAELGRDLDRGLIAAEEAEAAKTEIVRRLLRADAATRKGAASPDRRLRNAAVAAVVIMPLAGLSLYLWVGSPELPDRPLAARLSAPPETQDLAVQLARIDEHLRRNPDDGRGWEVVAPVYIRVGRLDDAVTAHRNAIRVLGSTADREVKLGLALVTANDGVTDDAVAAFQRAVALAPTDLTAHVYLTKAMEDRGRPADAVAAWRAFLSTAPAEAPWRRDVQAEVTRLEGQAPSGPAAAAAARGPSAADIAAASDLPADQRAAMIEGMVSSLAARLETNSGDAQGWAQLVRSYAVLGRPVDARAAVIKAKAALAGDREKIAIVDEAARNAGIAQ